MIFFLQILHVRQLTSKYFLDLTDQLMDPKIIFICSIILIRSETGFRYSHGEYNSKNTNINVILVNEIYI